MKHYFISASYYDILLSVVVQAKNQAQATIEALKIFQKNQPTNRNLDNYFWDVVEVVKLEEPRGEYNFYFKSPLGDHYLSGEFYFYPGS